MQQKRDTENKPSPAAYANMIWIRSRLAWVQWMDSRSRKMRRKQQYAALLAFTAISLTVCLFLALGGLGKVTEQLNLKPTPIVRVATPVENRNTDKPDNNVMKSRLEAFRAYIDSLERSPSGRRKRDSIVQARPGLLDSIKLMENIINNRKNQ